MSLCVSGKFRALGLTCFVFNSFQALKAGFQGLGLFKSLCSKDTFLGPPTGPAKLQRGLAVSGAGSLDRMETRAGRPEILRTKAEQARKPEDQGP